MTLYNVDTNKCLKLLQRAPALEYYLVAPQDDAMININTTTLYPWLHSLDFTSQETKFLEAISVPSLKELMYNTDSDPLPMIAMVSLLKCSGCDLKILKLKELQCTKNLLILLQAVPSLEHLQVNFWQDWNHDGGIDKILTQIFWSPSSANTIPPEETTGGSFLPCLQVIDCQGNNWSYAPFSWECIPQLYYQGHRCSLMLKSIAYASHMYQ